MTLELAQIGWAVNILVQLYLLYRILKYRGFPSLPYFCSYISLNLLLSFVAILFRCYLPPEFYGKCFWPPAAIWDNLFVLVMAMEVVGCQVRQRPGPVLICLVAAMVNLFGQYSPVPIMAPPHGHIFMIRAVTCTAIFGVTLVIMAGSWKAPVHLVLVCLFGLCNLAPYGALVSGHSRDWEPQSFLLVTGAIIMAVWAWKLPNILIWVNLRKIRGYTK